MMKTMLRRIILLFGLIFSVGAVASPQFSVQEPMDSGTYSPDALRQQVKLSQYAHWRYYDQWLPMNIERIWAYDHMGW